MSPTGRGQPDDAAGDDRAETALRGYQLTGDPVFLQPYTSGMAAYPAAQRDALAVAPSEQIRQRLAEQDTAARQWIRSVASSASRTRCS